MTFLLANVEGRVLRGIAERLPRGVRPNHLSGIGVLGAVGVGAAYALSGFDIRWLWVACVMLVVNWFGDSLDGTLARVRRIERPRYGYYLDHVIDAFSTAVVGLGLGLSPFLAIEVALVLVIVYLMLSVNVYLESSVFGEFTMAYGPFGPTEARLVLVAGNLVLLGASSLGFDPAGAGYLGTNLAAGFLVATMFVLLAVRFGQNLYRLARLEPQARATATATENAGDLRVSHAG